MTQTTRYEVVSDDEDELVIKKTLAVEPVTATEELGLNYVGQYRFDKTQKRITEGKFSGRTNFEDGAAKFSLNYEFLSPEVLKKEEAKRIANAQARAKAQKKKAERLERLTVPALDAYDPKK